MYRTVALVAALTLAAPAFAQQGQPGGHFIENWDQNGDGQVTVEEAAQRRDDVFFTFDADENGLLDSTEYDMFDDAREDDMAQNGGQGGHGGMQRVGEGMTRDFNDTDGDGMVSKDEFVGNTAAWIEMIDQNGDGVVTPDDFGQR